MKLLKKEEIAENLSLEKKIQIDEGVKIAKKVDALRATHAQEEQRLNLFRESTLRSIREEIDPLMVQKRDIEDEIRVLTAARIALQEPLTAEWERLDEDRHILALREKAVEERSESLINQAACIVKEDVYLDRKRIEMEDERYALEKETERRDFLHEERTKELRDGERSVRSSEAAISHREQLVTAKEGAVAATETDQKNRYTNLDAREKDLIVRELALKDGWETLLRTKKQT